MNNNKNKTKKISESNENCVGKSNKELKDADLKRKKQHRYMMMLIVSLTILLTRLFKNQRGGDGDGNFNHWCKFNFLY